MSMVINLVEDHNIYLCEGGPVYNGGVQPTPITYLTQWKIVGNSEVHTLPYPDGVVLPTGYKRCEYLEGDGTAYMELDTVFDTSDEITVKCALNVISGWKSCVATKNWNTPNGTRFLIAAVATDNDDNTKQIFSVALFTGGYGTSFVPYVEADTDVHVWNYNGDGLFSIDDTYTKQFSSYQPFTTDKIVLFRGHNNATKCKIYDFLQVKGNNTYHLIPCLDSNDTPCMYDVINNQAYYNSAGSGSFTYKLYPQPTEIWSCGEYNPTDGKYHILVQPQGGSIADIALDEPLRKVNDVADSIKFPSGAEGKALVTRSIGEINLHDFSSWNKQPSQNRYYTIYSNAKMPSNNTILPNILSTKYTVISFHNIINSSDDKVISGFKSSSGNTQITFRDNDITSTSQIEGLMLYQLATPTTELVDAPQIEEADSYSCVISQGVKAVEWSSFVTE